METLGVLEYPCEIVGINYVLDFSKLGSYSQTSVLIMVFHLARMSHFVPCHKEVIAEESTHLFINHYYRLHVVPKVVVPDRDHKFVRKLWQSFMGKLNTRLTLDTLALTA